MQREQFDEVVKQTVEQITKLLRTKGEEYSKGDDLLSHFKDVGKALGLSPLQVAMVFASKHYVTLEKYVFHSAAGFNQIFSEPIEGRLDDLINYCILMKALIVEAADAVEASTPREEPKFSEKSPNLHRAMNGRVAVGGEQVGVLTGYERAGSGQPF